MSAGSMNIGNQSIGGGIQESIPMEDGDDWTLAPVAPPKSGAEINEENSWREIPPGIHTLRICEVTKPTDEGVSVLIYPKLVGEGWQGQKTSFNGKNFQVRMCAANDPGARITDFFMAPPSQPSEQHAYFTGVAVDAKPTARPGFLANKFMQFLDALGFTWAAGGPLPADAMRPKLWVGRLIVAQVVPGVGFYTSKKTGLETPRGHQVKMFTYQRSTGAPVSVPAPAPQRSASAPAPVATPPVRSGVRSAASGVNSI